MASSDRGLGVRVTDWLRARLPKAGRRRLRQLTDPLSGPFGSIRGVRTELPLVALTFDDGPDPRHTPGILDALAQYNAKATWFVLLSQAEENPGLVSRILAEGHDIGLHGVDHRRLTRLSGRQLQDHIVQGVGRLSRLTGQPVKFFRPPYGSQNLAAYRTARRHGMQVVVWSADCDDWSQHAEGEIADRALSSATPGAILLLHDTLAADPLDPAIHPDLDRAKIVALILEGLRGRGLESLSLSKLLDKGDVHRTLWFRS